MCSNVKLRFGEKESAMKKAFAASIALVATAGTAMANPFLGTPVPEISALEGTAALAALAAVVLFVWERRRAA